jgi:nucleoside-diphosphate-sugar epimerase
MADAYGVELRTLVTGGSGFIGIHTVAALQAACREVMSLGTRATAPHGQENHYLRVDVMDRRVVMEAFAAFRPQEVVHLAARTHFTGRDDFYGYTVNTVGTSNVIAAIRATPGVIRALFASSIVVAAPAEGHEYDYATSKREMEAIVSRSRLEASGCSWALLRPGHVWGPWGGAPYRAFFVAIARGRYVSLGGQDAPKRLAYVGNVAHQIECLLRAPAERIQGRLFYAADHPPVCIADWALAIAQALGRRPPRQIPEPVVRLAAACGDALGLLGWKNPPLNSQRLRNMRSPSPSIPVEETLELTGPLPFTVIEGVEATVRWLRDEGLI